MSATYKPKLYLETSIFNFYNYGKGQQKQRDTQTLFERIKSGKYEVFTSSYAVDELKRDHLSHFEEMYALIPQFGIKTLLKSKEAERLADIYMAMGIVPKGYPDDAWHIALATIKGLDCIMSWNMGHIVKQKAMIGTGIINRREGFIPVILSTPKELLEYDTTTA
jgi:hypothetical protein